MGSDGRAVTDLTTAPTAVSAAGESVDVTLRAQQQTIDLPSGRTIEAWTFGALAGPAIVARVGDTLSVHLANVDLDAGATVHWHGYPVANAFDGVAGVTQDAVRPGEEFRADILMTQAGTYWYHTHQRGSEGVVRGLYGTLVVQPESGPTEDVDLTLPVHTFVRLGGAGHERRPRGAGRRTRGLRAPAADQHRPDAADVRGPGCPLPRRGHRRDGCRVRPFSTDRSLVVPAGGRIDVVLEMPASPCGSESRATAAAASASCPARVTPSPSSRPCHDGIRSARRPDRRPADTAVTRAASDAAIAIYEPWAATDSMSSGRSSSTGFPASCTGCRTTRTRSTAACTRTSSRPIVDVGDTVRVRLVNRSFETHPMHPHGHCGAGAVGRRAGAGQPLWLDTFDVGPGEVWEVALYADNPGIWMDHCHNLEHAALGMVTHLAYRGITTPFDHGGPADNAPE